MPQGFDEDYNGMPDAMEAGPPTKLMQLLMKLKELLSENFGDASDPGPDLGEEGGQPLPRGAEPAPEFAMDSEGNQMMAEPAAEFAAEDNQDADQMLVKGSTPRPSPIDSMEFAESAGPKMSPPSGNLKGKLQALKAARAGK